MRDYCREYQRRRYTEDAKYRRKILAANKRWLKRQSEERRKAIQQDRFETSKARFVSVPSMGIKRARVTGWWHYSRGKFPGKKVYDLVTEAGIIEAPIEELVIIVWPKRNSKGKKREDRGHGSNP